MDSRIRTGALVTIAVLATVPLAGCSGAPTGATPTTPAASSSLVGGMTTCDAAALAEPAAAAVAADSPDMKLGEFYEVECADGWAAAIVDVLSTDPAASGDGFAITLVFQAEGQFWIPKDRTEVCGTPSTTDPAARPDDAQVPAQIWPTACNTN